MMATKRYETDRMNRFTNPTITKTQKKEHQKEKQEQRAEKCRKRTDLQVLFVLLVLLFFLELGLKTCSNLINVLAEILGSEVSIVDKHFGPYPSE